MEDGTKREIGGKGSNRQMAGWSESSIPGQAHPAAQLTSLSTSPFLIFKKRNKNNTYLDRVVVRLK